MSLLMERDTELMHDLGHWIGRTLHVGVEHNVVPFHEYPRIDEIYDICYANEYKSPNKEDRYRKLLNQLVCGRDCHNLGFSNGRYHYSPYYQGGPWSQRNKIVRTVVRNYGHTELHLYIHSNGFFAREMMPCYDDGDVPVDMRQVMTNQEITVYC